MMRTRYFKGHNYAYKKKAKTFISASSTKLHIFMYMAVKLSLVALHFNNSFFFKNQPITLFLIEMYINIF